MVKLSCVRPRRSAASLLVAGTLLLSACSGGGGSPPPTPSGTPTPIATATAMPVATPTPTAVPANDAAFVCPSSDTPAALARRASGAEARRAPNRYAIASSAAQTRTVEIAYDRAVVATQMSTIVARERGLGASLVRSFDATGTTVRFLSVPADRAAALVSRLRTAAGVRSVALRGGRSYPMTVDAPYYTNDPYFTGFSNFAPSATSTPYPSTYEVLPYAESANVPGSWGDHAVQLEHAFAYSQANNGSGIVNAAALGSAAIKIAIIDTGADRNHPELASKIAYERCFITNPTSNVQSTSTFSLDPDGHGTDVSGIAAAASNNGFGFVGSGGNASIYAYRVDPTPDDACMTATGSNVPAQCGADTQDIASAIEDAIANHVNIISMSLGQSGGKCTNGVDPDTFEGQAVKDAIAANVIVVAASGNDEAQNVTPPACDAGVIAAGATALADGQPTGAKNTTGTAANPVEYVASYSDYGTPGASFRNASAWGIVAPGGDPNSSETAANGVIDDLHWIENIYTTTPATSGYAGNCSTDAAGGTGDCRVLIAGTSMSTPLVAGAAALILAVNGSYQSPTAMKQLLCSTADEINDAKEGCGRLNLYRAMATALHDANLP